MCERQLDEWDDEGSYFPGPQDDMLRELRTRRSGGSYYYTTCYLNGEEVPCDDDKAPSWVAGLVAGVIVVAIIIALIMVATKCCKKKFKCARIVKCCKKNSSAECCG